MELEWYLRRQVGVVSFARQRQNLLVNAGWTVLRFTWYDLTAQPRRVVADIRAALAR